MAFRRSTVRSRSAPRKYWLFLIALCLGNPFGNPPSTGLRGCFRHAAARGSYCRLHGRARFVTAHATYRIQAVTAAPDLRVKRVAAFPDRPGEWQVVSAGEDFTD